MRKAWSMAMVVSVAVMSMIAYQVQKITSSDAADNDIAHQKGAAVQPGRLAPPKFVKKRILQVALIAVLAITTLVGAQMKTGGKEYIDFVKDGSSIAYPQVDYGKAFGSFFKNPEWKYYKSKDDERVVEFSGRSLSSKGQGV